MNDYKFAIRFILKTSKDDSTPFTDKLHELFEIQQA